MKRRSGGQVAEESDATTRQQVLDLIVEKGPVTASAIAKVLGLTTAAVRRHITLLLESKEIAEHEPGAPSKRGRGRPARHYVATERAHIHLADGYSDLASKALGYLGQVGGEEAVESFAAARSREIERRYAPIVRDAGSDPRVRAQALADALTQDGYAATVRDIGGGTLAVQLCQGHCPIQNVAGDFPSCATPRRLPLASCSTCTSRDFPRLRAGDTCAPPTSRWACPSSARVRGMCDASSTQVRTRG